MLASPFFYFLYHYIHDVGVVWSSARAFTGTIRIVPIMGFMYGMTALGGAFVNQYFQREGQSYEAATGSAQAVA